MWSSWMRRTLSLTRRSRESEPAGAHTAHGKEDSNLDATGVDRTQRPQESGAAVGGAE
jgi:hypothetical protein